MVVALREKTGKERAGSFFKVFFLSIFFLLFFIVRTQFCPSDRDRFNCPGRWRLSGLCFHILLPITSEHYLKPGAYYF